MKILMTTDTLGGVWTYTLELVRGLTSLGAEVVLAIKSARLSPEQRAAARQAGASVYESLFRLEWQPEPWGDVERAGEWLLGLEAKLRPDVVHLNDYAHGALPFGVPVVVVGHSCVVSWWEAMRGTPLPPEWFRYRVCVREGIRGASAVVAPSRTMLEALERHYGPLPSPRAIYNGRSLGEGTPLPAHARDEVILAAGRLWDEAKNVSLLGKVARRLPWPVLVAGEAGSASLGGALPLGQLELDQVVALMRRVAIYALPVRYEPFGLSILEAALAGCALVLGDIPSQRELWDGAAEFARPEEPEALVFAIHRLARDPGRRAQLSDAARRRAVRYAPDRMAAAYLDLYRELAGHVRSRPPEVPPPCELQSSAIH